MCLFVSGLAGTPLEDKIVPSQDQNQSRRRRYARNHPSRNWRYSIATTGVIDGKLRCRRINRRRCPNDVEIFLRGTNKLFFPRFPAIPLRWRIQPKHRASSVTAPTSIPPTGNPLPPATAHHLHDTHNSCERNCGGMELAAPVHNAHVARLGKWPGEKNGSPLVPLASTRVGSKQTKRGNRRSPSSYCHTKKV